MDTLKIFKRKCEKWISSESLSDEKKPVCEIAVEDYVNYVSGKEMN